MILRDLAKVPDIGRDFGLVENLAEVKPFRFPMVHRLPGLEPVHAANHLVQLLEAQLRH